MVGGGWDGRVVVGKWMGGQSEGEWELGGGWEGRVRVNGRGWVGG